MRFTGTPISKGENKTGLVIFQDSKLAEKNRTAVLDTNITLSSLKEIPAEKVGLDQVPLLTNSSGTFANSTSIFTNATVLTSVLGTSPEKIAPSLVKSIPVSNLTTSLENLTSSQLAGIINGSSATRQEEILKNIPPLSPAETTTESLRIGPVNSSQVRVVAEIVDL